MQWRCNSATLPVPETTMCLSTRNILFVLWMNILLASVLLIFAEILFCKAEGPGSLSLTTGLVTRIWCAHRCDPASVSDWEPKPCSKPLQANPLIFFPPPPSPPGIKTNGLWESSEASFVVFCVSWNNFFSPPYHKKNSSETLKFEALEPAKSIPLYVSVLAM